MNYILCDYIEKFYTIYLDNIIIFFDSIDKYKKYIKFILEAFKEYEIVTLQLKSILFANEIEFLEYKIFSKEIQVNSIKFDKINNYSTFYSIINIKSFLDLVNYIAIFDFIPDLANHFFILTDLTKKNVSFI